MPALSLIESKTSDKLNANLKQIFSLFRFAQLQSETAFPEDL